MRTVTREMTSTWMPSFATPPIFGEVMTFGMTVICTASSTLRPARSIEAARSKSRGMRALAAEIKAFTTFSTWPPAR